MDTSADTTNLMVAQYERDYLMQMMNAINAALPEPIDPGDSRLGGDQEQYFKAIQLSVVNHFRNAEVADIAET